MITIILPNLVAGGAERLHVNLANDWIAQGIGVELILLRKEGDLLPLLDPAIKVIDLNVDRIRHAIFPIAMHLRRPRQVVLVAMWPLTSAVVLAWIISGRKIKLFLSEHVNLSSCFSGKLKIEMIYIKSMIKFTYRLASGVIAVSKGVRQSLCDIGGLQERKIILIYNPAAVGVSSVRESGSVRETLWGNGFDYHILAVGRLSVEKNHEALINAFANLPEEINAKLIILGEGPLRSRLEALVSKYRLEQRINLPGFALDPYPWYRSADLFVLSSRFEGFGNVIVEALECGLPIVSTNCPSGPSEILADGRYGKLVPVDDPSALATAIEESVSASYSRTELMHRARDFSVRKISNEYLNYFLINSRP